MDELNISRGFSPHFSPSRNLNVSENSQQQLFIHLPGKGFRVIKIEEAADVRSMVNILVGSMSNSSSGGAKPNQDFYALRLKHNTKKEIIWLPLSKNDFLTFHEFRFTSLSFDFRYSNANNY